MTNGWVDIKNSDVIFVMGGNPAENHPCGFKWAIEAKKTRNAKLVVVDPRFTRTAAVADYYAPMRAGSDIAILLVEQHAREALAVSDWACVMASGEVRMYERASALLERPDVGDIFLGRTAAPGRG